MYPTSTEVTLMLVLPTSCRKLRTRTHTHTRKRFFISISSHHIRLMYVKALSFPIYIRITQPLPLLLYYL